MVLLNVLLLTLFELGILFVLDANLFRILRVVPPLLGVFPLLLLQLHFASSTSNGLVTKTGHDSKYHVSYVENVGIV